MPFVWAAGAVWSAWEAYQLYLYLERKNLVYYVSDWDRFMQKIDEDPAFAQEMKEVLISFRFSRCFLINSRVKFVDSA